MSKRAALIAACVGASAAVGVTPAFAGTGENIFGSGSSLQKIAQQQVWTPDWHANPTKDQPTLNNNPTATYTSSSSGDGLAEFGNTTGSLDPTQDPTADSGTSNGYGVPVLDAYVGSDDPPTSADLGDASTAATGTATTPIDEVTVPAAQAPVAILFSLPTGITVNSSQALNISNALLQNIYNATVPASKDGVYAANTWGALLEAVGLRPTTSTTPSTGQFTDDGQSDGGSQSITLQVRSASSGTSYTLKGFLSLSGDSLYSSYVNDDDSWPVTTVNTGNMGGGNEVADTTASPGSVGYANTADAANGTPPYTPRATQTSDGGNHYVLFGQIQSNEGEAGTVHYSSPEKGTTGEANVYTGNSININGGNPNDVGNWTVPFNGTTFNPIGSWGGTQASDPDVYQHGGNVDYYPIVAATYDLGWTTYSEAGSNLVSEYGGTAAQAQDAGRTAESLLLYIDNAGQTDASGSGDYYAKLPAVIDADGKTAAKDIHP